MINYIFPVKDDRLMSWRTFLTNLVQLDADQPIKY